MQSSLEQFVKAAEVFPAAIVIADSDGRIVLVNGKTEAMFGYQRSDLIGLTIEMLLPERYRGRHLQHRHNYNSAPHTRLMGLGMDLVGRRKNGEEFPIEVSLSPVQTDTGTLVVSLVHDITARKLAEEELARSEARYRSLFENAVFGVFRSTPEWEFIDANPSLVAMLGYNDVAEVRGLTAGEKVDKNPKLMGLSANATTEDRFDNFETEWRTRSGETIWVRLNGRAIRGSNGELTGFEAIVEDITQRRLLEQQYQQAQKMEAIGRLAGGVAHDFNNLLTVIAVCTDSLMDLSVHNAPLRQTADEIARATEQGASLVRQLMAFGRIQPQLSEALDVKKAIGASQRMLEILAGEDIRLEFDFQDGDHLVAIEPNRVEQILMNLVSNSRDAMPDGGTIRISTALTVLDEQEFPAAAGRKQGKHVQLSVADTGQGIPSEILPHIFEPFFSTKAKDGRGSGLGLATVYAIVRQYEGYIRCESLAGNGTEFTIFLPAAEPGSTPATEEAASGISVRNDATILLIEDQPALRASVRRILEQQGYQVIAAGDGPEALKASESSGTIDLLITDIALPQMRGPEIAQHLKERRPQLRVLYMSGYDEERVALDTAHFIPKPFRRESLLRKVREVLDYRSE